MAATIDSKTKQQAPPNAISCVMVRASQQDQTSHPAVQRCCRHVWQRETY